MSIFAKLIFTDTDEMNNAVEPFLDVVPSERFEFLLPDWAGGINCVESVTIQYRDSGGYGLHVMTVHRSKPWPPIPPPEESTKQDRYGS